jgi:hypothetical protein
LTIRWNIFSRLIALLGLFLILGCVPLEKMDNASGTLEETDYLNSLAGIYEAVIQPQTGDEAIITLRLYPDGTCLFSEKTIGGPAAGIAISTGRWDHSDFSAGVALQLKHKSGARRFIQFRFVEGSGNLTCSGPGCGSDGLALIRQ